MRLRRWVAMAPRILEWEAVGSHKQLAEVVTEQAVAVHTELVVVVVVRKTVVGAENDSELVVVEGIRSELEGVEGIRSELEGVANCTL
jgi:hypothetical protein